MQDLKLVTILIVEDDLADQKLIKLSLCEQKIINDCQTVETAEQALQYLENSKTDNENFPWPDLILLDLNMPGIGGKEFLKIIKADDSFSSIPVIIMTTSDSEQDILQSYQLQASGYIKKPLTLQGFQEVLTGLTDYWFAMCIRTDKATQLCKK